MISSTPTKPASEPVYDWGAGVAVEHALVTQGERFELVQLLRLVSNIAATLASDSPLPSIAALRSAAEPALPVAHRAPEDTMFSQPQEASQTLPEMQDPARRLAVSLRSNVSFGFPATSVHEVNRPDPDGPIEVIANLFALAGNNGPLPDVFAELLLDRKRMGDNGLAEFLDIFHHRLLELYFTSTVHLNPWLDPVRPDTNELAQFVYAFAGLAPADLRNRMQVPDNVWLRYAGLLWHRPRSAAALAHMLSDRFKVPVRIGGPVGHWLPIEPEDRSLLGRPSCRLGVNALVGRRCWLREAGILLRIGPVDAATYERFLPNGDLYPLILEMVGFYAEDPVRVDLELQLKARPRVSSSSPPIRLGWTAFLGSEDEPPPPPLRIRYGAAARAAETASVTRP